jgi:hypothetical protein
MCPRPPRPTLDGFAAPRIERRRRTDDTTDIFIRFGVALQGCATLAEILHALSELAARLDDPSGIVVATAAERAAVAAASSQPDVTLEERLIGGLSSFGQGLDTRRLGDWESRAPAETDSRLPCRRTACFD